MKKILLTTILIAFVMIFTKYYTSNYEIEYKINNYQIKTTYNNKRFYFEIVGSETYNFDINKKRTISKIIISKIEELDLTNYNCIIPYINNETYYPLCINKENDEYEDYNLIDDEKIKEYQTASLRTSKPEKDFEYYNVLESNEYIALWNYKGYIVMNGDNYRNVNIFEKDKYDNTLSYMIKNTIYMPNYDEEHEFSKIVKFNIESKKIDYINLDKKIDFDSYIVGNIKSKLYIFDNKKSILYEVNLKNGTTTIKANNEKGFIKYKNGEWVICSKTEYKVKKIKFETEYSSNYTYQINNGLYKIINENKKISTKIADNITKIIFEKKDTIYYIYENNMYLYNPKVGNNKIFYNYELNFNNDNTMFVYIK